MVDRPKLLHNRADYRLPTDSTEGVQRRSDSKKSVSYTRLSVTRSSLLSLSSSLKGSSFLGRTGERKYSRFLGPGLLSGLKGRRPTGHRVLADLLLGLSYCLRGLGPTIVLVVRTLGCDYSSYSEGICPDVDLWSPLSEEGPKGVGSRSRGKKYRSRED